MYPYERSLVKKHADKPFAILGINSDTDRSEIKAVLQKEQIAWRSFWNGGSTQGPLSTAWNVRSWPTVYVLDSRGIIRYKSVGGNEKEIDAMIETLLKELEREKHGPAK